MIRAGAIAALALACAAPAFAGFPVQSEETCPVGGEKFTYTTTGSYSTFGQRPDGKPYGSWLFPLAMPECPSNGLVIYREFKPEEIPALTVMVASPEYQALRSETQYFRASWLSARLEPDDRAGAAFLLLQASWEADEDPARKARYQRAFVEAAAANPVELEDNDSLFLRFRLANAWRELGDFAAADAVLDSLPLAALDVTVPTDPKADYKLRQEARERRFLFEMIPLLRKTIAAQDRSAEPLDLVPEMVAVNLCADRVEAGATAPAQDRCGEEEMRKSVSEILERRRNWEQDDAALAAEKDD